MKEYILEIKKLIPQEVCEKIITYFDNSYEDAGITVPGEKVVDVVKNIRNCTRREILHPKSFGEKIMVNYIVDKIFTAINEYKKNHPSLHVERLSQLDLLKYESNDYDAGYKYHVDMGPKTYERHLSISICLNNSFLGGEFKFQLKNQEFQVPQNVGDVIIFPSNFMFSHQVNTVTKGKRYAIIGWAI